ncbi:MAG: glycosyltransferase family 1 protein [Candidatus Lokiarchaeota archaeon]|nr:glycosyltransferase family 1 protein [Candidatus Lokiarchaeota archaeon]
MYNILYFPTRYYPAISGAEFYIQSIAEIFYFKYKYEVNIFTSNAIDFKGLRESKGKVINIGEKYYNCVNNLKIMRFPVNYNISLDDKLNYVKKIPSYKDLGLSDECLTEYLRNGPYLETLLEDLKRFTNISIDLVHSCFYPYFNIIMALMIGKLANKPAICTPFFHFSNPRYLNKFYFEPLQKFDKIVACTHLEKKILVEQLNIPEEKIQVISMGVDYKKFTSPVKQKNKSFNFKQKYFKSNEKNYKMVLFCGYKNYEKGAISILKTIPYILKKHKKVYFVFIGPSTLAFNRELAKIQRDLDIRVINLTPDNLTGYYDAKKIAAFNETDVFLMPSRSDAYGIAFLEAWASSKPVIGANIGATPEVIRENIDGLLVRFDDPIDIADKIVTLLKKKRLRRTLGSNGKEKVEKNLSWDEIAKKTNKMYQQLIYKQED